MDLKNYLWTWISGSNKFNDYGRYGSKGSPSKDNFPGSRSGGVSWFDESNQILYQFGGHGFETKAEYGGFLNDLWKFSLKTNEWTWISGSNKRNQKGLYGTKLIPSRINCPGSRCLSASWFDESNQILYLFGGVGCDTTEISGDLNDLWSYSIKTNEWTWISGSNQKYQKGIYGIKGVPSKDNCPGSRRASSSCFDEKNQILYLYGGYGFDEAGNVGRLNDLWSYSIKTKEWTWISGSNQVNQKGIYGTKGVPSPSNIPQSRSGCILWFDELNQNILMFGGDIHYNNNGILYAFRNDLWSYSIKNKIWTWISGSDEINHIGSYGIKGVPSKDYFPGSRWLCFSWFDKSKQIFYLFGGNGYDFNGKIGYFNDLWSYSIKTNEWTWIFGSNEINQKGRYGIKGVPSKDNIPGSRRDGISWFDKSNKIFYLFGGSGLSEDGKGDLNDLWSYSISKRIIKDYNFTWINGSNERNEIGKYGIKGVPSKDNHPGSRSGSTSWFDESKQILYLFGGIGYDSKLKGGDLNDLWSYSMKTKEWTWISGSNEIDQKGRYGIKGVPSKDNIPGSRSRCVSWFDESNQILYLFGGQGRDDNTANYYFNDLWSYSIKTNEWTWISGSNKGNDKGNYGIKGVPSKDYYPSSRWDSFSWFDKSNQIIYILGGYGYGINTHTGPLNDLWSYSIKTNEWTWISGSNEINQKGIYGIKGVPSKDNYPGSRFGGISWFDESNQILYLFGGQGNDDKVQYANYNDVWSYSIKTNEWTWISGSNEIDHGGSYGRKRVPSKDHFPGSRWESLSWYDKSDQILYLIGGGGYDMNGDYGYFNDFWAFSINTNEWTWISGINEKNQKGKYGTKGVSSKDNYPGSRRDGISFIDETNSVLYLFGGYGSDINGKIGNLNDLWSISFIV